MNINTRFKNLGIKTPQIMLPNAQVNYNKWSVIACDQYTSELDYWYEINKYIGDEPSTLKLIYPECYLEEDNPQDRINTINKTMAGYIDSGILEQQELGFYLIRRETPYSPIRHGLIVCLDLEQYNFEKGSRSLIRATEGTILDRIPPRKRIRENALLELPHIMVLIDDPNHLTIEPLSIKTSEMEKMYEFNLMKNGGSISSFKVDSPELLEQIASALEKLADKERQQSRYGASDSFLFAMGDGNHSLATAKAVWEDVKKIKGVDKENHPARFALVEICNIHDSGILFEPIHRVVFNIREADLQQLIQENSTYSFAAVKNINEIVKSVKESEDHVCGIVSNSIQGIITFSNPEFSAVAGTVDSLIAALMEKTDDSKIDYIHGDSATCKIGTQNGNIGFILPSINKNTFFQTIVSDGVFPRKTFSMGVSDEKRFYIESRKIK